MGLPATTEQRVPQWDRVNPVSGRTEEAKLDIATSEPLTGAPLYFDFVVYTAHSDNQARLRALARTDGKAAADAAAEKRRRYEAAGPSLTPLPLEAGGGQERTPSIGSGEWQTAIPPSALSFGMS